MICASHRNHISFLSSKFKSCFTDVYWQSCLNIVENTKRLIITWCDSKLKRNSFFNVGTLRYVTLRYILYFGDTRAKILIAWIPGEITENVTSPSIVERLQASHSSAVLELIIVFEQLTLASWDNSSTTHSLFRCWMYPRVWTGLNQSMVWTNWLILIRWMTL